MLCAGGAARAASLGLSGPVIDPETLRLDRLVAALRAAEAISGPDTGELAAVALAGPGPRQVRAVAAGGGNAAGLDTLAAAAGWAYKRPGQPVSRP